MQSVLVVQCFIATCPYYPVLCMQSVLILPLLYSRFRLIPRRERHEKRAGAPYKRRWAILAIDLYDEALSVNRRESNRQVQARRKSDERNHKVEYATQAPPSVVPLPVQPQ